jgi:hypothetical protein
MAPASHSFRRLGPLTYCLCGHFHSPVPPTLIYVSMPRNFQIGIGSAVKHATPLTTLRQCHFQAHVTFTRWTADSPATMPSMKYISLFPGTSGLENREYGRVDPSRWPRETLYPQKLALTSPTSGGSSVGIVRSRTEATEFSFSFQFPITWLCGYSLLIGLYCPPLLMRAVSQQEPLYVHTEFLCEGLSAMQNW